MWRPPLRAGGGMEPSQLGTPTASRRPAVSLFPPRSPSSRSSPRGLWDIRHVKSALDLTGEKVAGTITLSSTRVGCVLARCFQGVVGAVRAIDFHANDERIAVGSLGRFAYAFRLKRSRRPLWKVYLTQAVTALLVSQTSPVEFPPDPSDEKPNEEADKVDERGSEDSDDDSDEDSGSDASE
eukprot:Polyplicarium_translucidae@DN1834_c0_g1_i3.p2